MKTVQLLVISFIITFFSLVNISMANAKPSAHIQHLKTTNNLIGQFNSYQTVKAANNLSVRSRNNFSTGLILTNPVAEFVEGTSQTTVNVINKSNEFFNSAMVVSDKLNQFINYFTAPSNHSVNKDESSNSKRKDNSNKCNKTLNFS